MGLEAVMLCMDNSEWTRNGDFKPSRYEGQQDAANFIWDAKTGQNLESTLGIMAMAGKRPEIYLTQTNDIGRLGTTIQKIPIHGYINVSRAVKIAQLSLKHRQNKNQKQRIVVFIGSPIEDMNAEEAGKLGKQLRKNDVAIDCVNFGHPENLPILQSLVDNCNKSSNSHLLDIQYGWNIADIVITSPIVSFDGGAEGAPAVPDESGAQPSGATGGGRFAEYGGIDPNLDPELAIAIRISLEEAKNEALRQQDVSKPAEASAGEQPQEEKAGQEEMEVDNKPQPIAEEMEDDEGEEEYDAALLEAIRMSKEGYQEEADVAQKEELKNDEDGLGEVIDEEFIGEIMQDLGVPLTEEAVKEWLQDDKKKDDKDKKKDKDKEH